MHRPNAINPSEVTLENVQQLSEREYRLYNFLKLNSIESEVKKLDRRLWYLGVGIIMGILAATLG